MKFIPYGKQSISEQDIEAVVKVLRSDWLTQGPDIKAFEEAVAAFSQAKYGVAVMNATAGLHIACLALGVEKGDWVWTSPNTFLASANCALYCGANIDFVDIDPKTYNMSAVALAEKLATAKKHNKLPKVVIPVHFAGQSCDMQAIKRLADQYGFKIIEDASHAIGGKYQGKPVGSCQYSDISIFSFHPVKIMTTAEGGMALTNNQDVADKLRLLRSHGMTREQDLMHKPSEGPWYYEQIDLGFNYRITDLQCALGLSQLQRVDEFVRKRNELAAVYQDKLKDLPLVLPEVKSDCYSSYH
ncbi:MAG: putative DegT/DnrJ/EryC1/StrS aminotransferase, partial [Gammaproteobacteria bacterium]|nr:putative DegT/DnrJ/EryC1/StrS aminotransferase [Gammaproteobacteria bacterium]